MWASRPSPALNHTEGLLLLAVQALEDRAHRCREYARGPRAEDRARGRAERGGRVADDVRREARAELLRRRSWRAAVLVGQA